MSPRTTTSTNGRPKNRVPIRELAALWRLLAPGHNLPPEAYSLTYGAMPARHRLLEAIRTMADRLEQIEDVDRLGTLVEGSSPGLKYREDGRFQVGDDEPFNLAPRQTAAVEAFLERPRMNKRDLVSETGYKHSPSVVRRLRYKEINGVKEYLRRFIECPGKKSVGTYHINVEYAV
jgi:hypothetical protein